ncbi:EH signature domain-containing protein [Mucilaginibacter sp.]|uniref:EH signature domain-containing protein n=1 Tax=Mucilaginibacter sp. TaxID=1882438 RepID=UPI00260B8CBD|nr:EH signature domain-containing protein [Mucilaginibacter sp.]MDB4926639.1 hypothetical protein [Mucilaginibacter sp.]
METANEILNFNFSPVSFQQAAKNTFSTSSSQLYDLRIGKLKMITDKVGETAFKFSGETFIPQVFKKFKQIVKGEKLTIKYFERRELRTLTYSLSHSEYNNPPIFSNDYELDFVFETLEASWKDSYLIGLIDCYLKNWDSKYNGPLEKLGKYIFEKLSQYDGGRTALKSLKANIKFFDGKNGDVLLGSELAIKNIQVKEATKYLSLPDSWYSYPYFTRVILSYYEKKKNDLGNSLDELNIALEIHSNSVKGTRANKILVSRIIQQCNKQEFAILQDKAKSIAFKLVGDPGNVSTWAAFENAAANEIEDLKKGRSILNEWITREFITVFFDLIKEPRRKNYWKKFSKQITGFTIVGPRSVRNTLLRDERISEYVNARFRVTESNREASAFIMRMKDYVLIEFSVSNYAFYALKDSHRLISDYETRKIKQVDEFVDGTMPMLTKRKFASIEDSRPEGRLSHSDGNFEDGSTLNWESVFDWWIKKYLEADV